MTTQSNAFDAVQLRDLEQRLPSSRRNSGSAWAGIAAGIFYAFVPFRFTQLPHVQHVFAGWRPMMLVALL